MTFFDFLTHSGAVEGVAADAGPATGTHLSTLAIELPHYITPAVAGLTVGSVVGVLGFIAVMLLVGRGGRRPLGRRKRAYDERLFIHPYATMQRETPLPPRAFAVPAYGAPSPAFTPSTALSARAFAKMGYAADADPTSDPMLSVEIEMDGPSGPVALEPQAPAVTVSPVLVLSAERDDKEKSAPHPLGIIKSPSAAMRAAPIADLSFDDSPTEIGETYFDEPPQPRRRTDPPKIRKIVPAAPRFSEQTRNG